MASSDPENQRVLESDIPSDMSDEEKSEPTSGFPVPLLVVGGVVALLTLGVFLSGGCRGSSEVEKTDSSAGSSATGKDGTTGEEGEGDADAEGDGAVEEKGKGEMTPVQKGIAAVVGVVTLGSVGYGIWLWRGSSEGVLTVPDQVLCGSSVIS